MAISIDGKIYKAHIRVKFGEDFPKVNRSMNLESAEVGKVLVYITHVGTPKWNNDYTVNVPVKLYITEVTNPSEEFEKKQRKERIGLRLVR